MLASTGAYPRPGSRSASLSVRDLIHGWPRLWTAVGLKPLRASVYSGLWPAIHPLACAWHSSTRNAPGGYMRKTLMLVALPVAAIGVGAAIVVATHNTKTNSSIAPDLQNATQ